MVVSWTSRLLRVFSDFSFFQIGSGAYGTPLPGRGGRWSRCLASAFGTQDPGFWDPKSRNGSLRAMRWSGSGGRIWSWWASHQPTRGADREEVDEHGALCSGNNPAQSPKGEAGARQSG